MMSYLLVKAAGTIDPTSTRDSGGDCGSYLDTAVNKTAASCFVTSNIETARIIFINWSNISSQALDTDNYIYENALAYLSGYVAMNLCKPINKVCSFCLCKLKGKPDKSYYLKFVSMKHFSYIKSGGLTVPSLELHTLLR